MKRIFFGAIILISACSGVFAASSDEVINLVGAGAVVTRGPYQGVGAETTAMPFFSMEHKDLYVKGAEAGYRFFRKDKLLISAVTGPRLLGYHSGDSSALDGMEDRRMSWDAGVKAVYELPWQKLSLSVKALADILGRYDGQEYSLTLSREFRGNIFRFIPSVGAHYQTKALVNYYYGVRAAEATSGRNAFEPGGEAAPFANALFSFGITPKWIVATKFSVEALGSQSRKSPIVDRDYILSAAAGLTYRF